jgi:tetratricopeptide (TPR) repeat protein
MRRILSAALAALLLLTLAGCGNTAASAASAAVSSGAWQEQYDLGLKYLTDGRYEEAIAAFAAVIEIDPKRADAFFGRGQAYHGLAGLVRGGGQSALLQGQSDPEGYCYAQALGDLKQAIELDPGRGAFYDEIIQTALESGDLALAGQYAAQRDEKVTDGTTSELGAKVQTALPFLDDMAAACQKADSDAVFALLAGPSYAAVLSLADALNRPILREYDGKTLGIYTVTSASYGRCMVYYGDLADGVRSGSGAWYGYDQGNSYESHGTWAKDAPNGAFETKEWNSSLAQDVVYRLVSGTAVNGLWDGAVVWAFQSGSGYQSWDCTFRQGIAQAKLVTHPDGSKESQWSSRTREGKSQSLGGTPGEENLTEGIAGFAADS